MYRVWTKNAFSEPSTLSDWKSYNECVKQIIGRWGHFPPFAFISKAKTTESFIRYNGE